MAYNSLPMGAVPIARKTLMELQGVAYEEVDFGEAVGKVFQQLHLIASCGDDERRDIWPKADRGAVENYDDST